MKIIKQLYVCVLIFLVSCSSHAGTDPAIPATSVSSGATMIPSPISSIPASTDTPLPQLQVITTANAGELRLLKMLQLPGLYNEFAQSMQCGVQSRREISERCLPSKYNTGLGRAKRATHPVIGSHLPSRRWRSPSARMGSGLPQEALRAASGCGIPKRVSCFGRLVRSLRRYGSWRSVRMEPGWLQPVSIGLLLPRVCISGTARMEICFGITKTMISRCLSSAWITLPMGKHWHTGHLIVC